MALTDNLIAYWAWNSSLIDEIGPYTITNSGTTDVAGHISNCRSFDGVNDTMQYASTTGFTGITANFSVNWWMKTASTARDGLIFHGNNSIGTAGGWIVETRSGGDAGKLRFQWAIEGGTDGLYTTTATFNEDEWVMVTMTFDDGVAKIYKNAGAAETHDMSGDGTEITTINKFLSFGDLFTNDSGLGFLYTGQLDELGYWDKTLTTAEIDELYNSGAGFAYPFSSSINLQLQIGDTWKAVDAIQLQIGGSWKVVSGIQINIGDTWKTIL